MSFFKDKESLYRIRCRDPAQIGETQSLQTKSTEFARLQSLLTLRISQSGLVSTTNLPPGPSYPAGGFDAETSCTSFPYAEDENETVKSVCVALNSDILLPLLRNDMSPSEILTEQFFVAETILHELAVKLSFIYWLLT